jgi:3-hydroxyacyl-CoA dehydrogenase
MKAIDKSLQRDVDKERLTADEAGDYRRIKTTTDIGALRDAFIVVERSRKI